MRWMLAAVLLTSSVVPAAGAQGGTEVLFELTDPRGDPVFEVGGVPVQPPAAPPDNPVSSHIDILALRVTEDDEQWFTLVLAVAGRPSPANAGDFTKHYQFLVTFRVGDAPVVYELHMDFTSPHFGGTIFQPGPAGFAGLCLRAEGSPSTRSSCSWQRADGIWYLDSGIVSWRMPKLSLVGHAADNPSAFGSTTPGLDPPKGVPRAVPAGTLVHGFKAEAMKAEEYFVYIFGSIAGTEGAVWRDRLPDEGEATESYALAAPVANHNLRLRVVGWQEPHGTEAVVAVEPGRSHTLMLRLENANDGKRIVSIDAHAGAGDVMARFEAPPSSEVPARDARNVRLTVDVSPSAPVHSRQELTVRGEALGATGDVAFLRLVFVAEAAIGPDSNTLWFHGGTSAGGLAQDAGFRPYCSGRCPWLNTLEDDPRGTADEDGYNVAGLFPAISSGTVIQHYVSTETPLVHDVRFDENQTAKAEIALRSEWAFDAEVTVTLFHQPYGCPVFACPQREDLAQGVEDAEVGPDSDPVRMTLALAPGTGRVSAVGTELGVRIHARVTSLGGGDVQWLTDLRFIPAQSRIVLPLIPVFGDDALVGNVTLEPAGSREEFVNPGATRSFHVLAVNQGGREERVRLGVTATPGSWTARVEPASAFVLPPGGSVNVTVLATAPPDAREGERGVVRVVVMDRESNPLAATRLVVIATTGVTLRDDAEAYSIDPEASQRIDAEDDGARSPGFTAGVAVAAFAVGFAWRRRRGR